MVSQEVNFPLPVLFLFTIFKQILFTKPRTTWNVFACHILGTPDLGCG